MLCRICTLQIQRRRHALHHADGAAPARQYEVDHIISYHTVQIRDLSPLEHLDHQLGIDDLSMICSVCGRVKAA